MPSQAQISSSVVEIRMHLYLLLITLVISAMFDVPYLDLLIRLSWMPAKVYLPSSALFQIDLMSQHLTAVAQSQTFYWTDNITTTNALLLALSEKKEIATKNETCSWFDWVYI